MLYFIVNQTSRSGKGAVIWNELESYLKKNNIVYKARVAGHKGHATELAAKISTLDDEDIRIIVVGGDGTVNEVINGIKDFSKVKIGIIPTGSGNDLARGLGIKGTHLQQLEKLVKSEHQKVIDLGKVTWNGYEKPRYFAISSGVGLDAIVCKKALTSKLKKVLNKLHLGKLTYIILTIQTLFSMDTMEANVIIDDTTKKSFHKVIFTAAMNFRAEGGGVPMSPGASPTDGKLSVCNVSGIPKWRTFFVLPFLVMAKHENFKGVDIRDCKCYEMHMNKPVVLHADGEYLGDVTDVKFECVPQKLRVID